MQPSNTEKQRPSIQLNKQSLMRGGAYIKRTAKQLPEVLLLQHNRWVEGSLFMVFSGVSFWIIFSFLLAAPPEAVLGPRKAELTVSAIDELELWLEERQTAYENPPLFPSRVVNTR